MGEGTALESFGFATPANKGLALGALITGGGVIDPETSSEGILGEDPSATGCKE